MSRFDDLEVFSKVVTAQSMSGAAREMGVSPAVVSKRLQRLEARLGSRLLNRTTRQISLTEAGETFYTRVVEILAGLEEAESVLSTGAKDARGVLKISVPTSFGRMHIAPNILKFMNANANLKFNIDLSDEYVDIVSSGIDLAIRIGELPDSTLVARKLAPVRRVLCASPKYIKKHGEPQSLEDLANHALIAPLRRIIKGHGSSKAMGMRFTTGLNPPCKPIQAKWCAKWCLPVLALQCDRHGMLERN